MVKSHHGQENANKCMAKCPDSKYNDGHQGTEEDSFSGSETSFSPINDDSMSSEEDGNPNNLSFDDDIFGLDLTLVVLTSKSFHQQGFTKTRTRTHQQLRMTSNFLTLRWQPLASCGCAMTLVPVADSSMTF